MTYDGNGNLLAGTLMPGGGPGSPTAHTNPNHQPRVPVAAGIPPYCSCGFVGGNGISRPLLATHLKENP